MLTINPVIWMSQIKRGLKHKHVPAVICFVFLAQQYTAKKKKICSLIMMMYE